MLALGKFKLSGRPGGESIPLLKGIIMEISHVTCPDSPFLTSRSVSVPDKKSLQTKWCMLTQSRQGSHIAHFFFPSLPENSTLYQVITLKAYEEKTKPIHGNEIRLLISFIKPNNAVTYSSMARWLKAVLEIDTAIFQHTSPEGYLPLQQQK